MIWAYCL